MTNPLFNKDWFKRSKYPDNFIPKGAKVFIAVDYALPYGDYLVKGFYDPQTGEFHIQKAEYAHPHPKPTK